MWLHKMIRRKTGSAFLVGLNLLGPTLVVLTITGCTAFEDRKVAAPIVSLRTDVGDLTYRAIDRLLAGAPEIAPGMTLAVSSMSDVERLNKSSQFGNIVADLARGRLVQQGISVAELRLRSAMLLEDGQGEMMLSRDPRSMVPPQGVAAIVTGTYAVGGNKIYVSLKLISRGDARIISAVDYAVPRYPDANVMLSREEIARR